MVLYYICVMAKNLAVFLITFIVIISIVYLGRGFIAADFNFFDWTKEERENTVITACVVGGIFSLLILGIYNDNRIHRD